MTGEEIISVIIPTYNQKELLWKAIDSVRKQTYEKIEILVVDDYGTDNLECKIKELLVRDSRIKYICNKRKKGVSGARNTGILEATGEYIAFLDSDDEWTENHLESMLRKLTKNNLDLGFCLWYEGQKNNLCQLGKQESFKKLLSQAEKELDIKKEQDVYIFNKDFFQYTILTYFYCYHLNTMVIKRERLIENGLFDESLKSSEDCKLLFSLLSKNKFLLNMDHQYFYYYWPESTYSFFDRSNINIYDVIKNKSLVSKLTLQGEDKIKVRRYSWKLVKKSEFCTRKNECKREIKKAIYNKYITLGIINQSNSLLNSLKYFSKAFIVKKNLLSVKLFFKILINKIMKNNVIVEAQKECMDLY